MPGARTLHTWIPALLPIHAQRQPHTGLERSRPRQSENPDRRVGHPRNADHDLERARLPHRLHCCRALPRLAARPPRLPGPPQKRQLRQRPVLMVSDPRTRAQAYLSVSPQTTQPPPSSSARNTTAARARSPTQRATSPRSPFCDRQFDATVRSALGAESDKSPTAASLWAKADRLFTDQAPVVPMVTPSITDFVSHRVGDYQFNPQVGVLIDQLWVH